MLGKNIAALVALQALLAMPAAASVEDADSLEQFHADGIVYGSTGVTDQDTQIAHIKGTFVGGNAVLTFRLLNGTVGDNGTGAHCAYKSGTATITATDLKTITMSLAGVGCTGPGGTGNTEVTYVITGGTKWNIPATAGGTGRFSWGYKSSGALVGAFVQFDGNIKLSEE